MLFFSFVCLHFVYPMLPVSMDCPFLIAPSVFSNVYFVYMQYIHLVVNIYYLVNKQWPGVNCERRDIAENGNSDISFTVLASPYICACPMPALWFSSANIVILCSVIWRYLLYHCSSSFKSGHTYSTIQWNTLNLLICWESVSLSRVFYCHCNIGSVP
jgi:hypothetical protein